MTIFIDGCLLAGLFGTKASRPGLFHEENYSHTLNTMLFWLGVAAGIGLFLIRLTGKDAWATGHLFYSLLPRT